MRRVGSMGESGVCRHFHVGLREGSSVALFRKSWTDSQTVAEERTEKKQKTKPVDFRIYGVEPPANPAELKVQNLMSFLVGASSLD